MPPLNPEVADLAPSDQALTAYDQQHAVTYMRLLDTDAEGADWREVARIVLLIDPEREPDRARQTFEQLRSERAQHRFNLTRELVSRSSAVRARAQLADERPAGTR